MWKVQSFQHLLFLNLSGKENSIERIEKISSWWGGRENRVTSNINSPPAKYQGATLTQQLSMPAEWQWSYASWHMPRGDRRYLAWVDGEGHDGGQKRPKVSPHRSKGARMSADRAEGGRRNGRVFKRACNAVNPQHVGRACVCVCVNPNLRLELINTSNDYGGFTTGHNVYWQ